MSASALLTAGAPLSIIDGSRTERIKIAAVVDSTHITLADPVRFSHASGSFIFLGIAQDNVIEGNTITGAQAGNGILNRTAVRTAIRGNTITGSGVSSGQAFSGINFQSLAPGPGSVLLGGNGSAVSGNIIGSCTSSAVSINGSDRLAVTGNYLAGHVAAASNLPVIQAKGLTDSTITGNVISDCENGQGIILQAASVPGVGELRAAQAVTANAISRCASSGLSPSAGTQCDHRRKQRVFGCGGHAGINLQGVSATPSGNCQHREQQRDRGYPAGEQRKYPPHRRAG